MIGVINCIMVSPIPAAWGKRREAMLGGGVEATIGGDKCVDQEEPAPCPSPHIPSVDPPMTLLHVIHGIHLHPIQR